MKISIIIPAYNVERFLALCLDSVLAQTYQEWEALLVDDGSTDATPMICDEYGKRDARIRVWHKENEGLSDTRQFAIPFVTGEYVLCIDSDDCIHPEFLERAVAHAEKNPEKIIQMGYRYVPEDFADYRGGLREGDVLQQNCHEKDIQKNRRQKEDACQSFSPLQAIRNIDEDEKDEVDRVGASVVWGKLYPVRLFEHISFPKHVRLHEDQRINHRLFAASEGVLFDTAPLYFYRTREQSLIRKSWRPERLYMIECYLDRLDCVKAYADTEEGKRLIELVYRRLLVCIIRNYTQMRENLTGKERREQSDRLLAQYRRLWRENREIALPKKKKPILNLFRISPLFVAWLFRIRG